jgi:hypothetical protein
MAIAESKRKLALKIRVMPANYESGMAGFFGTSVSGSIPVASYKAKVKPGMEDKWERNLKNAFGL